jgi:NADH-quinone oxidoreductase subunit H
LLLSLLVPIIKTKSISLGSIIMAQQTSGSFAWSVSGLLAMTAMLLCIHAKMGIVPFDLSEAETELAAGSQIEYSGFLLALWKIAKMMMLVIGPLFIVALFLSGGNAASIPLKYGLLFLISVLIRNTNPRVRIDQAIKFFWGKISFIALASLVAAAAGF